VCVKYAYRYISYYIKGMAKLIKWYTCGPTVYDSAHIGHARTYILVDLMIRQLKRLGNRVEYGMNITDIDDKIIAVAKKGNVEEKEVSRKYTDLFFRDMINLNVEFPDKIMNVTDHVQDMINDIKKIVVNGYAYEEKGSVYFNRKKYLEDGYKIPELKSVGIIEEKSDSGDFVLWKSRIRGEDFGYDSPFGFGIIGWHLECTTLSHLMFPGGVDVHSGGIDLAFPHHTNEIIQNNILDGDKECKFVSSFVHIGHLHIDGCKMSKSLKNFITIEKLLERYSSDVIRFYFMTYHYSSNIDFSYEMMESSKTVLQYIVNFIKTYQKRHRDSPIVITDENKIDLKIAELEAHLSDDYKFNIFIEKVYATINQIYALKVGFTMFEIVKFIRYVRKVLLELGFVIGDGSGDSEKIIDKINDFRFKYRKILKNGKDVEELKKQMFSISNEFRSDMMSIDIKLEDKAIGK
jgi:cysteinyl-tRNA synthetase